MDTDDGFGLPDKDYQPDLPTGTAPDRQRRIEWADANFATIDGLLDGTLVAVPRVTTEAMLLAAMAWRERDPRRELTGELDMFDRVYRAMITEHLKPGGEG